MSSQNYSDVDALPEQTESSQSVDGAYEKIRQRRQRHAQKPAPSSSQGAAYAGFWIRSLAFLIDFLLVTILGAGLQTVIGAVFDLGNIDPLIVGSMRFVVTGATFWLYWALFEVSSWRSTPGKRMLGLRVISLQQDKKLSFYRASLRQFVKALSVALLGAGFFMAAFTKKKQTLHDKFAGCVVLRKKESHWIEGRFPNPKHGALAEMLLNAAVVIALVSLVIFGLMRVLTPAINIVQARFAVDQGINALTDLQKSVEKSMIETGKPLDFVDRSYMAKLQEQLAPQKAKVTYDRITGRISMSFDLEGMRAGQILITPSLKESDGKKHVLWACRSVRIGKDFVPPYCKVGP